MRCTRDVRGRHLAEHLRQPHHQHRAQIDEIGQEPSWPTKGSQSTSPTKFAAVRGSNALNSRFTSGTSVIDLQLTTSRSAEALYTGSACKHAAVQPGRKTIVIYALLLDIIVTHDDDRACVTPAAKASVTSG